MEKSHINGLVNFLKKFFTNSGESSKLKRTSVWDFTVRPRTSVQFIVVSGLWSEERPRDLNRAGDLTTLSNLVLMELVSNLHPEESFLDRNPFDYEVYSVRNFTDCRRPTDDRCKGRRPSCWKEFSLVSPCRSTNSLRCARDEPRSMYIPLLR